MITPAKFTLEWAGRPLTIETGKFAGQANSACTVQYGETMVLATCVIGKTPREGVNFLPLMIDYEERLYAAGKIKGSRWIKRDGRPTDEAVTMGRMIDRGLRPLFDERIRRDIQVNLTVLSYDQENTPDIPALLAASAALAISEIPWHGPIAGVRVGRVDGQFILNPLYGQREASDFDLILGGTGERISMLDASLKEIDEDTAASAMEFGQAALAPVLELIAQAQKEIGLEKISLVEAEKEEKLQVKNQALEYINQQIEALVFDSPKKTKQEKNSAMDQITKMADQYLEEQGIGKDKRSSVADWVYSALKEQTSKYILEHSQRVDGRALDEIRPLTCEVDVLPHNHGSAMFKRGGTQVLSIVTLGAPGDEQYLDGMELSGKKSYFHHYNFRPFSVGEVGPTRSPGRREIGHGALAEKAVIPTLPIKSKFPYTICVVSEVLESNGSSSMASACASSMALMAAGVPVAKPVAGIAIGIATEKDADTGHIKNYRVFTDLQDIEDGEGGMDFKVTGTPDGITAIQMDTKTTGLTKDIVREALRQARDARLRILDVIASAIPAARPQVSPLAPKISIITIDPEKIRDVIGPGGKTINEIIAKTGADIDIEQDGTVFITADTQAGLDEAQEWVRNLTRSIEVGEIFNGKVVKIMDFGAFVELLPKQDGLIHISELSTQRVNRVEDVVNVGDIVPVKVIRIDDQGKISLSMKAANINPPAPAASTDDTKLN